MWGGRCWCGDVDSSEVWGCPLPLMACEEERNEALFATILPVAACEALSASPAINWCVMGCHQERPREAVSCPTLPRQDGPGIGVEVRGAGQPCSGVDPGIIGPSMSWGTLPPMYC